MPFQTIQANNYPYAMSKIQIPSTQPPPAAGHPYRVGDLFSIQQSLQNTNLWNEDILKFARLAMCYGEARPKIPYNSQWCNVVLYSGHHFVFSQDFETVLAIHPPQPRNNTQLPTGQYSPSTNSSGTSMTTPVKLLDCESFDEQMISDDIDDVLTEIVLAVERDLILDDELPELYFIEISMSQQLWDDVRQRMSFGSKKELMLHMQKIKQTTQVHRIQLDNTHMVYIWADTRYVYAFGADKVNVLEVFDQHYFHTHYADCLRRLRGRVCGGQKPQRQLSKRSLCNTSGRSIVSNASSASSSKRSVFTTENGDKKHYNYHTIYLKPIIERMRVLANNPLAVDSDFIVDIVDNAIKHGKKRQISKRTFEFKYDLYTVIMSKSLKTILDVTLSSDKNVITVHPDVVSIISKKRPQLDYFTIQKVAQQAKQLATYSTKKNDYRQQYIYDHCGCRIVFASNHTTIVEMQCNDLEKINQFQHKNSL